MLLTVFFWSFCVFGVIAFIRLWWVATMIHYAREYVESRSRFPDYVDVALWFHELPVGVMLALFWVPPHHLMQEPYATRMMEWRKARRGIRKN